MKKFLAIFVSVCLLLQTVAVSANQLSNENLVDDIYSDLQLPNDTNKIKKVNSDVVQEQDSTVNDFVYNNNSLVHNIIVEPRFSSIRISWTPIEGALYEIYRGKSADSVTDKISGDTPLINGTSEYIDETAGTNNIWFYKVKMIKDNVVSTFELNDTPDVNNIISNSQPTGLSALQLNSKFNKEFSEPENIFDGKTSKSYSNDAVNVAGLKQGTVIMNVVIDDDATAENQHIFGAYSNERDMTEAYDGIFLYNHSKTPKDFRYNFFGGMVSSVEAKPSTGREYTIVYTAEKTNGKEITTVRSSVNGQTTKGYADGDKYKGFFGYSERPATTLVIGGSPIGNNFKGKINFVTVTDQVLSQEEMNKLSFIKTPPLINISYDIVKTPEIIGTIVGDFNIDNAAVDETFSFSLISGVGSEDNSKFEISNNTLKTKSVLETGSYRIRVKASGTSGTSVEKMFTITAKKPIVRNDALFYPGDATDSNYFRIPALYTTKQGTIIASIDARFGGGSDSPNNLDTTVRRSFDGGNTWDNATLPNLFLDAPNQDGYNSKSASFIDPIIFEDETANNGNGRLFMVVDAFPSGGGIWGSCEKGSAFDSDGYLKIRFKSETSYNYIAKPNNNGYDIYNNNGNRINYTLNGKFEVYKDGKALTVPQYITNKQVPMNIFYELSDLQILKTSYLYLTHSDDQGVTWSDPIIVDGNMWTDSTGTKQQVKDPSMNFFGTGPGRGIQLKNGANKGRLVFPAYQFLHDTDGYTQRSALVYSDDGGVTWQRGKLVDTTGSPKTGYMSESVPVELPDGSIALFGRTNMGKVGYVVSTDGGVTWQDSVKLIDGLPSNNCQLSAISYSKLIDGKPAIIVSAPEHPGSRKGGVMSIGLIDEDGTYENGLKKYSIEWKYKTNINSPEKDYKYSCLTELPNGNIMVLYESNGDSIVPYDTFTIDEIKGAKKLVFSDKNVTVTKNGNTNNAKKISDEDFNNLKNLSKGTFIIKFKENTTSAVGTIFGIANSTNDTGFHIYSDGNRICYQFLDGKNTVTYNTARANLNKNDFNTIAFKADKINREYKLISNGKVVGTIPMSDYAFIKNILGLNTAHIGTFQRPDGKNPYLFDGFIEFIEVHDTPLSDDELIEITKATYKPTEEKKGILFYNGDATDSEFFRIPSIITTKKGTVVASIDARFGGTADSPNNLDTAVRRSFDNGKTWDKATLPNHFEDFADASGYKGKSASFIDPVMLEDTTANNGEGRIFMMVDAFPGDTGLMGGKCATGTGYDKDGYLELLWLGETEYTNKGKPNSSGGYDIYNPSGYTGYSLNAKFELFKNSKLGELGEPMMMTQNGSNKKVPMNVFYDGAQFTVRKTSYLYLTYSDDQGVTWSDPISLNPMVKDSDMTFLGTGPGTGIQLKNGKNVGRLLFPVYQWEKNTPGNSQLSALIYSDDAGKTWTRGDFVSLDGFTIMSESVPIELPDGSVSLFGRTDGGKIGQAISTDGGKTWKTSAVLTDIIAPYSQLTAINYSKQIDGKPAIILASASNPKNRVNGFIRIGLISEDGTYEDGSKKYSIDWSKYKKQINGLEETYGYSCLTELTNGDIMVFYEGSDLKNIPYVTFTLNQLISKEPINYPPVNYPSTGSGSNSSSSSSSSSDSSTTPTTNNNNFWGNVSNTINSSNNVIELIPEGETKMPASVVNQIKGKDKTITLNYKDYTISINGNTVGNVTLNNYDMKVNTIKEDTVSNIVDNTDLLQFEFTHKDDFPFTLNIKTNLGSKNINKNVYIYALNTSTNKLEYIINSTSDVKGDIVFDTNLGGIFIVTDNIIKESTIIYIPNKSVDNTFIPYFKQNGKDVIAPMSNIINGKVYFKAPETAVYEYKQNTKQFNDISKHWANEYINFVTSRELFSGIEDAVFAPDKTMTRGMIVTVLGRLSGIESTSKSGFTDVSENQYYSPYILWATENKIVSGKGDNKFAPDEPITREEMAVLILNYSKVIGLDLSTTNSSINFEDVGKISAWAKDAIRYMQNQGLLGGKGNNQFDPSGTATRAEVSTVLYKLIDKILSE